MKDNLPNYLNPHNIDPSRIEPAHIDTPPGNDSIRPGMNKCGMLNAECEMREGAPFDEYGMQIALAGGDWSKGIQDHAERNGPFLSDSRLRHFVRHEQPPTMSNAEAIEVLKHIETDIYGRIAIGKAIDALQLNLNGNAIGALQFNDTSAELQAHSHTHTSYSQPGISLLPKAVCPRCGKYMTETGFMNAGVIQCSLHTWLCKECGIRREQAYDWPNFQPQEWHRPTYSIKGGEWIGEDEPKKLKAALEALPPLPKVDTPFGFERIGGDWEETAE